MKDKLLNTFSVESNGETININVLETEKGIKVDINGNSMDVFINGESCYSRYDIEEYKYIPVSLREFVRANKLDYNDLTKKDGFVECDLNIAGREYYTTISTNRAKNNNITFTNDLENYTLIEEYNDLTIPNGKEELDDLISKIKEHGYTLGYSHAGNETYDWYQLVVPIPSFNEIKVLECMKLWYDYNKSLEKFIK